MCASTVKRPFTTTGPFTLLHIDVSELEKHPDALRDIIKRKFDVLIVRNVFPKPLLQKIIKTLKGPAPRFEKTLQYDSNPAVNQLYVYGITLSPYVGHPDGPDLDEYYEAAGHFRRRCRELFSDGPDFETRLEEVFARLGGKRKIAVPPAPGGRTFTSATIRELPPGTEIPVHVGNYFRGTGAFRDLAGLLQAEDQLSYFVPMAAAEKGGELVVYDLEFGDPRAPQRENRDDCDWGKDGKGDQWPSYPFNPQAGDLLVFNGGRFYHRVAPVEGADTRWTIGGFLEFSKDDRTIYYWS